MTFMIEGRLDNLNDYIRAMNYNRYKGNALKKNNQVICNAYIMQQLRGVRIEKPVTLHFRWYEPSKSRDLDNISSFGRKVIQDALVECGVLKNDGWSCITGFTDTFHIDKKRPRIEIEIEVVK
jgi:Endodeoxyribonuclease RusA.